MDGHTNLYFVHKEGKMNFELCSAK